jgi:hypothetical protein
MWQSLLRWTGTTDKSTKKSEKMKMKNEIIKKKKAVTRERPLGSSSLAYLPRLKNKETLEAQETQD